MTFNLWVYIWISIGIITFLFLYFSGIKAPYGRHSRDDWGRMIDNRWGWFIMELPALLVFPILVLIGPRDLTTTSWIALILWSIHYVNRTLIFPFKLRTQGKKMPVAIMWSAIGFNLVNGFVNGYYLGFLAPKDDNANTILLTLGVIVFFSGMAINRITDKKLISLRKEGQGYKIPKGWLFKYISCPNHFGEIIEWTGFAIAIWNLPALSFAIWTFCNLAPRAFNHHEWYRSKFENYPKNRKALIPFLW